MKRKKLILVITVLVLLGAVVRFALVAMLWTSADTSAQSAGKRYEAKVSSKWRTPFWGGAAYDRHEIAIASADGRQVRHIVLDDGSKGWAQDCSIEWAADSLSVTFAFKRADLETTRLIVNVEQMSNPGQPQSPASQDHLW
jgi:hypothetical protein